MERDPNIMECVLYKVMMSRLCCLEFSVLLLTGTWRTKDDRESHFYFSPYPFCVFINPPLICSFCGHSLPCSFLHLLHVKTFPPSPFFCSFVPFIPLSPSLLSVIFIFHLCYSPSHVQAVAEGGLYFPHMLTMGARLAQDSGFDLWQGQDIFPFSITGCLWGPLNLLYNGYWCCFYSGKGARAWSWPLTCI
jgi:hypothetical protein